ncbi:MAG: hypothetical protein AB8B91_12705 [Rubripirellula sp.]
MQLDRTHVVIRLRTLSEIGDLALIMVRRYPAALLIGFAAGASVWAVSNAILLSWIPLQEAADGLNDEEAVGEIWRYCMWMMLLVISQTPIAGVLTTVYLGQAVFEQRPTWASVFVLVKKQFWRLFWILGCLRMAVPAMVLLAFRWGQPVSAFWDVLVPIVLILIIGVVRSNRPFTPEILLLEQCPLRSDSDAVITVSRRSKSLHGPMSSELGGRFMGIGLVLAGLLLSILSTILWVRGVVLGEFLFMNLFVLLVVYPLSLWIVAGISVLVRLLNYLDTRIRLEGWEVELAVRAEAMRQFGDEAGLITTQHMKPKPLANQKQKSQPAVIKTGGSRA